MVGAEEAQARAWLLKAPGFQSLIGEKERHCFQLEPLFCELAPLQRGARRGGVGQQDAHGGGAEVQADPSLKAPPVSNNDT